MRQAYILTLLKQAYAKNVTVSEICGSRIFAQKLTCPGSSISSCRQSACQPETIPPTLTCPGSGISSCRQSACQPETVPPTPGELTVMCFQLDEWLSQNQLFSVIFGVLNFQKNTGRSQVLTATANISPSFTHKMAVNTSWHTGWAKKVGLQTHINNSVKS